MIQAGPAQPEKPFKVQPFKNGSLVVQAENFDIGGEGVAYHDTDPNNRGNLYRVSGVDLYNFKSGKGSGIFVGATQPGEFLNYTVTIPKTGKYDLSFVVASSGAGGKFHMNVDGANRTKTLVVPNTKGGAKFATITKKSVRLKAGKHVLQIAFDAAGVGGSVGHFDSFSIKAIA